MFGEVDWRRRSDEEGKEKRVRNSDLEDLQKKFSTAPFSGESGRDTWGAPPSTLPPTSEPGSHEPVELYANARVFVCSAMRYSLKC